ncbi:MAG: hypothetical protein F6K04_19365 [Leptolyngbya sp. SIO4C5]|nr:hypothetical protein [Leptolyngbya sp. SIO4C5]
MPRLRLKRLLTFFSAVFIALSSATKTFLTAPALAQACPYAQLRLEVTQTIDRAAVCAAARPWFRAGIQVLIYVTAIPVSGQQAWHQQLDRVEAEAGLRQISQGTFAPNAVVFAVNLAAEPTHSIAITYGSQLSQTPIGNSARLKPVKQAVRQQLPDNLTAALLVALTQTYQLFADVPPTAIENLPQQQMPRPALAVEAKKRLVWLGLTVGAVCGAVFIGWRSRRYRSRDF